MKNVLPTSSISDCVELLRSMINSILNKNTLYIVNLLHFQSGRGQDGSSNGNQT